ncbi:MAG TPA: 50S ribosomal protein L24 [Nitrospirae bacterium]|nr:50S ribosomal protein L24 [Nitrospirota bacterium]HDH04604.1 50S ribosomal protein L24 [Nitrospirota bacterium]
MGLGLKKNDTVSVITGEEKGKKGRVLSVDLQKNRLLVEGLNMIKKHMKPNKQFSQGGIIDREAPIRRSNVMLVCTKCDKPTRIGNTVLGNGKKIRSCKKCGEVID